MIAGEPGSSRWPRRGLCGSESEGNLLNWAIYYAAQKESELLSLLHKWNKSCSQFITLAKHAVGMNERNENMFIRSSQEEEETRPRPRGSVCSRSAQFRDQGSLIFRTFTPSLVSEGPSV